MYLGFRRTHGYSTGLLSTLDRWRIWWKCFYLKLLARQWYTYMYYNKLKTFTDDLYFQLFSLLLPYLFINLFAWWVILVSSRDKIIQWSDTMEKVTMMKGFITKRVIHSRERTEKLQFTVFINNVCERKIGVDAIILRTIKAPWSIFFWARWLIFLQIQWTHFFDEALHNFLL